MKREREIKFIRNRKRLNKRYSDFELALLASEIDDYTFLLKSIKFPIEKYKLPETKKESGELLKIKDNNNNENIIISLNENNEKDSQSKEEKYVRNDENEEYDGLKVKKANKKNKKKRK